MWTHSVKFLLHYYCRLKTAWGEILYCQFNSKLIFFCLDLTLTDITCWAFANIYEYLRRTLTVMQFNVNLYTQNYNYFQSSLTFHFYPYFIKNYLFRKFLFNTFNDNQSFYLIHQFCSNNNSFILYNCIANNFHFFKITFFRLYLFYWRI